MTRMITLSSATRSDVPGLVGATVDTEPSPGSADAPRRRRSRFPTPLQDIDPTDGERRPTARWAGADGALRELVRDHAMAVGLTLRDGSSETEPVCTIVDAAALVAAHAPAGRGGGPLLVVTDTPEVPAAIWPTALAAGARAVLPLPADSDELLSRLIELARPESCALLLGVVGGCGGAGASSFAARLAAAARPHGPVTLIDADPLGGGTDLLIEAPPLEGILWREAADLGPDDGEALRTGLPRVDEVGLLVAGEDPGPTEQSLPPVLSALAPLGGTVVVDLGPELIPVALEHLHQLLVVVPATDHAVRAAARRLRAWQPPTGLARAVVRRNGPLGPGEVSEDLGLPLAASFRDFPRGTVPLLDVRRRGADRAARELMAQLTAEVRS